MFPAHRAVKAFHQPLTAAGEERRCFVARGVEVFAIDGAAGQCRASGVIRKLRVEPPFVRPLIFDGDGAVARGECVEIFRQALPVVGIVDRQIVDVMPFGAARAGEVAHGGKDGENFLRVMQDVIAFLPHFHHDVAHVITRRGEPAVARVELVAENEAKYRRACRRFYLCECCCHGLQLFFRGQNRRGLIFLPVVDVVAACAYDFA